MACMPRQYIQRNEPRLDGTNESDSAPFRLFRLFRGFPSLKIPFVSFSCFSWTEILSLCTRKFLDANVPVFHLVAVGLQADGTGLRQLESFLQHLPIAGATSYVVLHHHLDFIPLLRLVLGER